MASHSLLIIEDDPTLLRGLQDNFQSRGFRVHTAVDGEAGLAAALGSQPDLILLDIMLPKMNGFEVCCAIRQREIDTPIIMLTAKGQEEDIIRGLNLGADDYVTKPFNIRELLARVNAFLRRRPHSEVDVHRFGNCELDLTAHKLFKNGEVVPLTAKEFGLLQYFLERVGRAATRQDIMDCVWGSSVIVTARSVDRCVATLRAKIEPDSHQPTFIQTIRDIGYRFEIPETRPREDAEISTNGLPSGHEDSLDNLELGGRLGRYEIQSLLGKGGMACVYRARDVRLDRNVALKVLNPQSAKDADLRSRFERENKAIASLSHKGIRAIHDVAHERGWHFAVMELLEGETLRDRLGCGPVKWPEALSIAVSVAEGLDAAHRQGIVHRDIKPANIFLVESGDVKILDFGLARWDRTLGDLSDQHDLPHPTTTSPGCVLGTVSYMSPEQVRGQVADARSDVFSLGSVIHEMIAGRPAFARRTPADTMAAILTEDPPQLTEIDSDVPTTLQAAVSRSLMKSPQKRYQSSAEFSKALRDIAAS